MPSYTYIALDAEQKKVSGSVTAGSRGEALKVIERKGLRPTQMKESDGSAQKKETKPMKSQKSTATQKSAKATPKGKSETKPKKGVVGSDGRVKLNKKEVILFTEELSDMLAAGLQLEPALKSMESRQQQGGLQQVSERVRALVRDGTAFSKAVEMVSPSFGPLFINMAAAGEASGALDVILRRQVHYLKTLGELQNKVILALVYPAFLVLAAIGVGAVFVINLIPQLSALLESVPGAKMPAGAAVMLTATDFLRAWWWVFLIVALIAFLVFKGWKDKEENKPVWDRVKLNIPLFGAVSKDRFYVQFLETMSNLVGNGLTLLRALDLTKNATQNLHFKAALEDVIEKVGDGRSLSSALKNSGEFPDLFLDMVVVGEQTGQIDQALGKAAERYDKELNNSLQRIMALLMPTVLVFIAILVGMIVYLLLTAIFQTINQIGA